MNYSLLIIIVISAFLILQFFGSSNNHNIDMNVNNLNIKKSPVFDGPRELETILLTENDQVDFDVSNWEKESKRIKKIDADFSWYSFSKSVDSLHNKVLMAFSLGDKKELLNCMSSDLFHIFSTKINEREQNNLIQYTEIISSHIKEIQNITLIGTVKAVIDVYIFDKVISFLTNQANDIAEGSKNVQNQGFIWTITGNLINKTFNWNVTDIKKA